MQNDTALPALIERLSDAEEHIMVRHEAAEALGAIGNLEAKPVLEEFLHDENPEVAEALFEQISTALLWRYYTQHQYRYCTCAC